jgi:hypothetical protein
MITLSVDIKSEPQTQTNVNYPLNAPKIPGIRNNESWSAREGHGQVRWYVSVCAQTMTSTDPPVSYLILRIGFTSTTLAPHT